MKATHMRARAFYEPRPVCGRYAGAFLLTDELTKVTCLRCLRRLEFTAEVRAQWARALAVHVGGH